MRNEIKDKSSHCFVALEGVDGSGKSSIARALGERQGFAFIPNASGYVSGLMREHLSFTASGLERAVAYAASLIGRQAQIASLPADIVGVTDRSLWSTLCLLQAREPELVEKMQKVFSAIGRDALPFPTVTIVVDTPFEICRARISKRSQADQRHDEMSRAEYERHMAFYRSLVAQDVGIRFYSPNPAFSPAETAEDISNNILKGILA